MITETTDASRRGGRFKDEVVRQLGPKLRVVLRRYIGLNGEVVHEKHLVERDQTPPGRRPWQSIAVRYCPDLQAAERAAERAAGATEGSSPSAAASTKPYWHLGDETTDWRL